MTLQRVGLLRGNVREAERIGPSVYRFRLHFRQHEKLAYRAGQHVHLVLSNGDKRPFSIANAPNRQAFIELHIKQLENGVFLPKLLDDLRNGGFVGVEGPSGSACLDESSMRPVILVCGGTGFAPLKGILEHAFRTGAKRPLHLYWGANDEPDVYMYDLVKAWERENDNFSFTPVLLEPQSGDWQGEVGYATDSVVRHRNDLKDHDIFIFGPPTMVQQRAALFLNHGARRDRIFSDMLRPWR